MIEKTAFKLLAIKNRSEHELRKKLLLKGFPIEEVNLIIKKFVTLGYLQDAITTKTRFAAYVNKGYGPSYIAIKMKHDGLTMPSYSLDLERQVIQKLLNSSSFQKKSKQNQAATLQRRGFHYEIIYELLMRS